jgi:hypothetical protein
MVWRLGRLISKEALRNGNATGGLGAPQTARQPAWMPRKAWGHHLDRTPSRQAADPVTRESALRRAFPMITIPCPAPLEIET